jgi:hypothetical protein
VLLSHQRPKQIEQTDGAKLEHKESKNEEIDFLAMSHDEIKIRGVAAIFSLQLIWNVLMVCIGH